MVEGLRNTSEAIREAANLLCENAPHGRDYYVQDGRTTTGLSYAKARKDHDNRIEALRRIQDEIMAIAIGVHEQVEARKSGGSIY